MQTTTLYESDYYQWAIQQAELLRTGQLSQLDIENLVEEIEDLSNRELNACESLMTQILIHLLYLKFWHSHESIRGWTLEVKAFRKALKKKLTKSIANKLDLDDLYDTALGLAQAKSNCFDMPEECPWTLAEIIGE